MFQVNSGEYFSSECNVFSWFILFINLSKECYHSTVVAITAICYAAFLLSWLLVCILFVSFILLPQNGEHNI